MSDLRSVVRSLTPEEKQRLREGLRSVEDRLTPLLTEQPQDNIPEGGAFSKAAATSSESKSR